MEDVIYDENGQVDWNANGWPEPNSGAEMEDGEYSTKNMPDDIFDQWLAECDNLFDVEVDY